MHWIDITVGCTQRKSIVNEIEIQLHIIQLDVITIDNVNKITVAVILKLKE